jgi:hypothetical protein
VALVILPIRILDILPKEHAIHNHRTLEHTPEEVTARYCRVWLGRQHGERQDPALLG